MPQHKKRISWVEKREGHKPAQVKILEKSFAGMVVGQKMLLPSPPLIEAYIRSIPAGKTGDPAVMRDEIAHAQGAEKSCPIVTGILLRVIVEAAHEEFEGGRPIEDITPFWRMIDETMPIINKLSFDPRFFIKLRAQELA